MSGPAINFLQQVVKDDWTREVPVGFAGSAVEPWLDADNSLVRVGSAKPLQAGILRSSGWQLPLTANAPAIPGAALKVSDAGDELDWSDTKPLYEPVVGSVGADDYYAADGTWKRINVGNILGYTPADDSAVLHKEGNENILGTKSFLPVGSVSAIQIRTGDGTGPMSGSSVNPGIVFRSLNNTVERAAIYVTNSDTFTLQSSQGSSVTIASAINLSAVGAPVRAYSNSGLQVRNLGDTADGPISGGLATLSAGVVAEDGTMRVSLNKDALGLYTARKQAYLRFSGFNLGRWDAAGSEDNGVTQTLGGSLAFYTAGDGSAYFYANPRTDLAVELAGPGQAATSEKFRFTGRGALLIGSATDDGVNALQVTGKAAFTDKVTMSGIASGAGGSSTGGLDITRTGPGPYTDNNPMLTLTHSGPFPYPYVGMRLVHENTSAGNYGGAYLQFYKGATQEFGMQFDYLSGNGLGRMIMNVPVTGADMRIMTAAGGLTIDASGNAIFETADQSAKTSITASNIAASGFATIGPGLWRLIDNGNSFDVRDSGNIAVAQFHGSSSGASYIKGGKFCLGGTSFAPSVQLDVYTTAGTLAVRDGLTLADAPITAGNTTLSGNLTLSDTTKSIVSGSARLRPGGATAVWSVPDTLSLVGGSQSLIFGGSGAYCHFRSNVAVAFKNQAGTADGPITALSLESPASYLMLRGKSGDVRIGPETGAAPSNAVSFQLTRTDGSPMMTHSVANTGVASISSYSQLSITAGVSSSGLLQLNAPGAIGYIQLTQNGTVRQQINTDGSTTFYSAVTISNTQPAFTLQSSTNGSPKIEFTNTAGTQRLVMDSGRHLMLSDVTAGSPNRLFVRSTGSVGIGDFYDPYFPKAKLDVAGDLSVGYLSTETATLAVPSSGLLVKGGGTFGGNVKAGGTTSGDNGLFALTVNGVSLFGGGIIQTTGTISANDGFALQSNPFVSPLNSDRGASHYGITIHGRDGSLNSDGSLYLRGGDPSVLNENGGHVYIDGGIPTGTGTAGNIILGSVRGNVLIGSGTPVVPLEVKKDGTTLTSTDKSVIIARDSTGVYGLNIGYDTASGNGILAPVGSNGFSIWTHNGTTRAARLSMTNAGVVTIGSGVPIVLNGNTSGIDYCNLTLGQWNLRSDNTGALKIGRSSGGSTSFTDDTLNVKNIAGVSNITTSTWVSGSSNFSLGGQYGFRADVVGVNSLELWAMDTRQMLAIDRDTTRITVNPTSTTDFTSQLTLKVADASTKGQIIKLASVPTANALEVQGSASNVLSALTPSGGALFNGNVRISGSNRLVFGYDAGGVDFYQSISGANDGNDLTYRTYNSHIFKVQAVDNAVGSGVAALTLNMNKSATFADSVGLGASPAPYPDWNGRVLHVYDAGTNLPHVHLQNTLKNALVGLDGGSLYLSTDNAALKIELNGSSSRILSASSQEFRYQVYDATSSTYRDMVTYTATAGGGGVTFVKPVTLQSTIDANELLTVKNAATTTTFSVTGDGTLIAAGISASFGGGSSSVGGLRYDRTPSGASLQAYGGKPLILNQVGNNVLIGTATDDTTNKLQVAGGAAFAGIATLNSTQTAEHESMRFNYSTDPNFYNYIANQHGGATGQNRISFYVRNPTGLSSVAAFTVSDQLVAINKPPTFATDVVIGEASISATGRLDVRAPTTSDSNHLVLSNHDSSYRHRFASTFSGSAAANNTLSLYIASGSGTQAQVVQWDGTGKTSFFGGTTITGGGVSGTDGIKIGSHSTGYGGIWPATVTPSSTNYGAIFHANETNINSAATVTLATGGTNRWQVNSSGNLLGSTDNAYDIGAAGANRPRNVYIAQNLNITGAIKIGTSFGPMLKENNGTHYLEVRDQADTQYGSLKAGMYNSLYGYWIQDDGSGTAGHAIKDAGSNLSIVASGQTLARFYGNATYAYASGVRIGQITTENAPYYDNTTLVVAPQRSDLAGITSQGIASQTGPYYTAVNSAGGREFAVIPGGSMSLYNSYTDSANYESFQTTYSGGFWQVGSNKAGTGSQRMVRLLSGGTKVFDLNGNGSAYAYGSVHFWDPTAAGIAGYVYADYSNHMRYQQTAATGNAYYGIQSSSNTSGATFLTAAGANIVAVTPSAVTHTPTWNNVATTFTAFTINATDTASASGSKLADLQVGGVSKLAISKGGSLTFGVSGAGIYSGSTLCMTFGSDGGVTDYQGIGFANGNDGTALGKVYSYANAFYSVINTGSVGNAYFGIQTSSNTTGHTYLQAGGSSVVDVSTSNVTVAPTWNNVATTFTALKVNATDTASATGSLLQDWQVGGASKAKIDKGGAITAQKISTGQYSANEFYAGPEGVTIDASAGLGTFPLTVKYAGTTITTIDWQKNLSHSGSATIQPTWNNAATTFTALQLAVTDTASAAASKLVNLMVGGSSKFSVDKTGAVAFASDVYHNTIDGINRLYFGSAVGATLNAYRSATAPGSPTPAHSFRDSANNTLLNIDGSGNLVVASTGVVTAPKATFSTSLNIGGTASTDVLLKRSANFTLSIRGGGDGADGDLVAGNGTFNTSLTVSNVNMNGARTRFINPTSGYGAYSYIIDTSSATPTKLVFNNSYGKVDFTASDYGFTLAVDKGKLLVNTVTDDGSGSVLQVAGASQLTGKMTLKLASGNSVAFAIDPGGSHKVESTASVISHTYAAETAPRFSLGNNVLGTVYDGLIFTGGGSSAQGCGIGYKNNKTLGFYAGDGVSGVTEVGSWSDTSLTLRNALTLPAAVNHGTDDGKKRFYFDGSGASYYYSGNTATAGIAHIWREAAGANLMYVRDNGNVTIAGTLDVGSTAKAAKLAVGAADVGVPLDIQGTSSTAYVSNSALGNHVATGSIYNLDSTAGSYAQLLLVNRASGAGYVKLTSKSVGLSDSDFILNVQGNDILTVDGSAKLSTFGGDIYSVNGLSSNRSLFLLGQQASGGLYGYLAYHGGTYNSGGVGFAAPNTTTLYGSDSGGLTFGVTNTSAGFKWFADNSTTPKMSLSTAGVLNVASIDYPGSTSAMTVGSSAFGFISPGAIAANKSGAGSSSAINIASQNLTIGYDGVNPFLETYDKTLKINATNHNAVSIGGAVTMTPPNGTDPGLTISQSYNNHGIQVGKSGTGNGIKVNVTYAQAGGIEVAFADAAATYQLNGNVCAVLSTISTGVDSYGMYAGYFDATQSRNTAGVLGGRPIGVYAKATTTTLAPVGYGVQAVAGSTRVTNFMATGIAGQSGNLFEGTDGTNTVFKVAADGTTTIQGNGASEMLNIIKTSANPASIAFYSWNGITTEQQGVIGYNSNIHGSYPLGIAATKDTVGTGIFGYQFALYTGATAATRSLRIGVDSYGSISMTGPIACTGSTLSLGSSSDVRLNRSALGALDLEVGDGSGTWQKALRALYAVGGVQVALAGQTPASPSTGWSASNYTPDKTLDGATATLADVINTLGSILDRLKEVGIISA